MNKPLTVQQLYTSPDRWCKHEAFKIAPEAYAELQCEAQRRNFNGGVRAFIAAYKILPPCTFSMCLGGAIGYVYSEYDPNDPRHTDSLSELDAVVQRVIKYIATRHGYNTIPAFNDAPGTMFEEILALVRILNI